MLVLIVEADSELAARWADEIERMGAESLWASGRTAAVHALQQRDVTLIVLNLGLPDDGAFAVADFASYARPDAKVLFVSASDMLTDGSVFRYAANACGFVGAESPPEDIAAMALFHGAKRPGKG